MQLFQIIPPQGLIRLPTRLADKRSEETGIMRNMRVKHDLIKPGIDRSSRPIITDKIQSSIFIPPCPGKLTIGNKSPISIQAINGVVWHKAIDFGPIIKCLCSCRCDGIGRYRSIRTLRIFEKNTIYSAHRVRDRSMPETIESGAGECNDHCKDKTLNGQLLECNER